eukprot:365800-Chlamydomonas_euryale.AAC.5
MRRDMRRDMRRGMRVCRATHTPTARRRALPAGARSRHSAIHACSAAASPASVRPPWAAAARVPNC